MSEQDDAARSVREAFAAHDLRPSDEELATYSFVGPMLRMMADQLYNVEIGEEL